MDAEANGAGEWAAAEKSALEAPLAAVTASWKGGESSSKPMLSTAHYRTSTAAGTTSTTSTSTGW